MVIFDSAQPVGIFRGFTEGGMEFHADLTLPYKKNFQCIPMQGQFLIVQLETEHEAVLGRITSFSSEGKLTFGSGEEYGLRALAENRDIPDDLREQYLKYRINIRVLGVLRSNGSKIVFAPSHRRLPHVGSKVAFLSDDMMKEVVGHNIDGADLGFLAFGEFVFAGDDKRLRHIEWMNVKNPAILPKFNAAHLVSRRTFVFARAGFGKSNLIKLLFSNLYKETPFVEKRAGKKVPVGTIIFDPEGEYFWPDDKNRPGLCDVPGIEDKLVVFTPKNGPSPFYQSFVASGIKLDIRRLKPSDVISIALSPERQEQQNVRKLKGLNAIAWGEIVDEIYRNGNNADINLLKSHLNLESGQDFELYAARANMTAIVKMLHDPSSQMLDMIFKSLKAGKLCVVDLSQLRGEAGLVLSGLVLRKIFEHNQAEFTKSQPEAIPVITVVEEAQTVLGSSKGITDTPYIEWVKEGRKYDLGAVMITQQPGSISHEILSQGDNWFVFHLLSSNDLVSVKRANAHFSDDLLACLLNEPIPGNCVFWSSVGGKPYPIPIRVLSFEEAYKVRDPDFSLTEVSTTANKLKAEFEKEIRKSSEEAITVATTETSLDSSQFGDHWNPEDGVAEAPVDFMRNVEVSVAAKLREDKRLIEKIKNQGIPWKGMVTAIEELLPDTISDKNQFAYNRVRSVMDALLGADGWGTESRPSKSNVSSNTTWIIAKEP